MKENKYFELRGYYPLWGFLLDGKKEVQKAIATHNNQGWHVVQFEWGSSKRTLFGMLVQLLIMWFTLGFMSYWSGFAVVFERDVLEEENTQHERSSEAQIINS